MVPAAGRHRLVGRGAAVGLAAANHRCSYCTGGVGGSRSGSGAHLLSCCSLRLKAIRFATAIRFVFSAIRKARPDETVGREAVRPDAASAAYRLLAGRRKRDASWGGRTFRLQLEICTHVWGNMRPEISFSYGNMLHWLRNMLHSSCGSDEMAHVASTLNMHPCISWENMVPEISVSYGNILRGRASSQTGRGPVDWCVREPGR